MSANTTVMSNVGNLFGGNMSMSYIPYIPKYFKPEELVPREALPYWYKACDWIMLKAVDKLSDIFGPIVINNYLLGGNVQYAGFRPEGCTVGEKDSQHRFGRAFDLKFRKEVNLEDVIDHIVNNMPEIRIIRKYSWGLHIDNRNSEQVVIRRLG
jgi:hypothetical protein